MKRTAEQLEKIWDERYGENTMQNNNSYVLLDILLTLEEILES